MEKILLRQQQTLEALLADLIKRQEMAINEFLKMFSGEINEFYSFMNPEDKVENIRLVPMIKNDNLEGIVIEYDFQGKAKSPPSAYLSESRLNSLGLSFFLASVKAFNKINKYFLLDDVISSFDRTHKTQFFKLLLEKFSDYQVLFLTHEKEFFDEIADNARSMGWLQGQMSWIGERGAELTPIH